MADKVDLLYGAYCADCGKLITVWVHGSTNDPVAKIMHDGKVCPPAQPRRISAKATRRTKLSSIEAIRSE
jgi:glutamate synthase domain-containing protein 3